MMKLINYILISLFQIYVANSQKSERGNILIFARKWREEFLPAGLAKMQGLVDGPWHKSRPQEWPQLCSFSAWHRTRWHRHRGECQGILHRRLSFPSQVKPQQFRSSEDGTSPCLSHPFKRALLEITQESLLGLCSLLCDYYSAANPCLDPAVLYSKSVQVSAIWHLLKTDCILGDSLHCKLFILACTACFSMLRKSWNGQALVACWLTGFKIISVSWLYIYYLFLYTEGV